MDQNHQCSHHIIVLQFSLISLSCKHGRIMLSDVNSIIWVTSRIGDFAKVWNHCGGYLQWIFHWCHIIVARWHKHLNPISTLSFSKRETPKRLCPILRINSNNVRWAHIQRGCSAAYIEINWYLTRTGTGARLMLLFNPTPKRLCPILRINSNNVRWARIQRGCSAAYIEINWYLTRTGTGARLMPLFNPMRLSFSKRATPKRLHSISRINLNNVRWVCIRWGCSAAYIEINWYLTRTGTCAHLMPPFNPMSLSLQ